jgi:hypothetical protein
MNPNLITIKIFRDYWYYRDRYYYTPTVICLPYQSFFSELAGVKDSHSFDYSKVFREDSIIFVLMEKTPALEFLDREICNYHHKYNYTKKDDLFCYQPDKKQIANFYKSMNDHILQGKLKNTIETKRKNRRNIKVKSQI